MPTKGTIVLMEVGKLLSTSVQVNTVALSESWWRRFCIWWDAACMVFKFSDSKLLGFYYIIIFIFTKLPNVLIEPVRCYEFYFWVL